MRRAFAMLAAALFAVPARAQDSATHPLPEPVHGEEPAPEAPLLLALWIDGADTGIVAHVHATGGAIWIDARDLAAAGVEVPADAGTVRIDALGIGGVCDVAAQRLMLTVVPARLRGQVFDVAPLSTPPTPVSEVAEVGANLRYDLSGNVGDVMDPARTASGGVTLRGMIFSPEGTLSIGAFATAGPAGAHLVRLDTAAEFDDPDVPRRFVIGDAVSTGPQWSRGLHFGGVQIASDFALQPDRAAFPLPQFLGVTAVPATIDVFVNAAHAFEAQLAPGPFTVVNLPVLTGRSEVAITTTDILGRETTQVLSFYTSDALLRPGLSAYEVDAGFLRRDYGIASFAYGRPFASATYRRGIADWLTAEFHGEATQRTAVAGGGLTFALATFGTAGVSAAASKGGDHAGALYALSFDTQSDPVGIFGSFTATTGNYTDIAAIEGAPPLRHQWQFGAHMGLGDAGSLALSWLDSQAVGGERARFLTASWSLPLGRTGYVGATAIYDAGRASLSAEAFLSLYVDGGIIASAETRTDSDVHTAALALARPADPDGGLGWHARVDGGDDGHAEVGGNWVGDQVVADADVAVADGRTSLRGDLSGELVFVRGSVFAAHQADGAAALVETGRAGVPVYRENRAVGRANDDGEALITGLAPYTANRIAVKPSAYPMNATFDSDTATIAPPRDAVVVVDLAPHTGHAVLLSLVLEDGSFVPSGAQAALSSGERATIGHRGALFVTDAPPLVAGEVDTGSGLCRFRAAAPPDRDGAIVRLDRVLCVADAH